VQTFETHWLIFQPLTTFDPRESAKSGYLEEIRGTLGGQVLAYVPEMERDVTGIAMIEKLAERLFQ
jgi:hypothetical protein